MKLFRGPGSPQGGFPARRITNDDASDEEYRQWYEGLSADMQDYEAQWQIDQFAAVPSYLSRFRRADLDDDRLYRGG